MAKRMDHLERRRAMLVDRSQWKRCVPACPSSLTRPIPCSSAWSGCSMTMPSPSRSGTTWPSRYRLTLVQGRHATPAAVLLRLLVVPHLDAGSSADTVERVADWLVVRWCCRVEFPCVPDTATLLRWAATVRPETLQALTNRAAQLAKPAKVTRARTLRIASTGVQMPLRPLAG